MATKLPPPTKGTLKALRLISDILSQLSPNQRAEVQNLVTVQFWRFAMEEESTPQANPNHHAGSIPQTDQPDAR